MTRSTDRTNSTQALDVGQQPPVAPSVLAVGCWSTGEFGVTFDQLEGSAEWPVAGSVPEAIDLLTACPRAPEIALIAVARPNDYPDDQLFELQQAAPLLRLVVVAGTWCEGELRTGQPPAGFLRLYWHELPSWWRAAVETTRRGAAPPWSSPLPDRFAGPPFPELAPAVDRRRLIVDASDPHVWETLEAVFTPLGWSVQWQPRRRPDRWMDRDDRLPTAGLFDGSQLDADEAAELAAFCRRMAPFEAPVVVLLDYPRREHQRKIRELGATGLLGKPYRVEALAALLDEALTP